MIDIIDALPISASQTRVGVLYYSDNVNNYFFMNDPDLFNDKEAMKTQILNMGSVICMK